jgi:hypothetical protein
MPACPVNRTGIALAALVSLLALDCKKEEDVQYPPTPPQNYAQPSATQSAAPPAASSAPPAPVGPAPLDALSQTGLEENIKQRAKKDAAGMKEVGALFGGTIPEGGHVESVLNMDPGKCYVVLAAGQGGVVELDIEIQNKMLPIPPIAVDNTSGADAAIKPCYKNILPVPLVANVWLKASRGGGAVAGRVYVK